jgi:small subunit ribosomal protein S6
MRTYETIFILKPDLPEEEIDQFISQMETIVTSTGGNIRQVERMGRRRLAYMIRKYREGYYTLFDMECEVPAVRELERRLRVADPVIKYLTVRMDEQTKRLNKLQGVRAKKLARKKPKPGSGPAASASAPATRPEPEHRK